MYLEHQWCRTRPSLALQHPWNSNQWLHSHCLQWKEREGGGRGEEEGRGRRRGEGGGGGGRGREGKRREEEEEGSDKVTPGILKDRDRIKGGRLALVSCTTTGNVATRASSFYILSLAGQTLFFSFLFIGGVVGRKIIVWSNSHA